MNDVCKVKICGITSTKDAVMAAGEGVDYLGALVEADISPRSLTVEEAAPVFDASPVPAVVLVHRMEPDKLFRTVQRLKPFAVQFLSPDGLYRVSYLKEAFPGLKVWQSLFQPAEGEKWKEFSESEFMSRVWRCKEYGMDAVLFDTVAVREGKAMYGGTGCAGNWDDAARMIKCSPLPTFLAGGINPANVREAIEKVCPYGVDLSSGVEERKGKKSLAKIKALMEEVNRARQIDK